MRNSTLVVILVLFMAVSAALAVTLIHERKEHKKHPCSCETCMKNYWEAIRIAYPQLKIPHWDQPVPE